MWPADPEPPARWRALAILAVGTLRAMLTRVRGRPEAAMMANGRR